MHFEMDSMGERSDLGRGEEVALSLWGQGNSECKGSQARACLVYPNSKDEVTLVTVFYMRDTW